MLARLAYEITISSDRLDFGIADEAFARLLHLQRTILCILRPSALDDVDASMLQIGNA